MDYDYHPDWVVRMIIGCSACFLVLVTHFLLWRVINRKLGRTLPGMMEDNFPLFALTWAGGCLVGVSLWGVWDKDRVGALYNLDMGMATWLGGMIGLSLLEMVELLKEHRSRDSS